jgi:TolB protein
MRRALLPAAVLLLLAWTAGAGAVPEVRNGRIAFVSVGDVWVVNADGTGLDNITHSAAREAYPTWSPEGTRIVFSSNRGGPRDLWIMNADGSGLRRLTRNNHGRGVDSAPTLSPDGRRVAFARRIRGDQEIYVMNLDGTGLRRLTRHPGIDFDPAWSPDGTEIAFWRTVRRRPREVHQIFVVNADGSALRRLTRGADSDAPAWSLDGKRIAYTRLAGSRGHIWVMRADGTGQQRVTSGAANDDDPAWAPDGTAIAFTSDRAYATPNVYVFPVRAPLKAARVTRVTDLRDGSGALTPVWQPLP